MYNIINTNKNIKQRHSKVKEYVYNLFFNLTDNTFIKIVDNIDFKFKIDNSLIEKYNKCTNPFSYNKNICKLKLTKDILN